MGKSSSLPCLVSTKSNPSFPLQNFTNTSLNKHSKVSLIGLFSWFPHFVVRFKKKWRNSLLVFFPSLVSAKEQQNEEERGLQGDKKVDKVSWSKAHTWLTSGATTTTHFSLSFPCYLVHIFGQASWQ